MKKIFSFIMFSAFVVTLSGGFEMPTYAQTLYNNAKIESLRSEFIEWRYKAIDGKLYRRQYNLSKSKWIGEWELVE